MTILGRSEELVSRCVECDLAELESLASLGGSAPGVVDGILSAGGHLTPDPIESIYSGVVSIRSLRLVIFLAKLNNLEVWGADIGNAYLEAKTKEKLYIVAGPEFEELEGHILVIYKVLYGLKSSGLRWSQKIHDIMLDMGFSPSKADPCVWL